MFPQNQYPYPISQPFYQNNPQIIQNQNVDPSTPDGDSTPEGETINNNFILDGIFNTKNKINMILIGNNEEIVHNSQAIGHIFNQQKGIMVDLQQRKQERENKRKKREIICFFNHNGDILPLEFHVNKSIEDVLKKYLDITKLKNVKFKYKDIELKENDTNHLLNEYGLVTGSEILVEDIV